MKTSEKKDHIPKRICFREVLMDKLTNRKKKMENDSIDYQDIYWNFYF